MPVASGFALPICAARASGMLKKTFWKMKTTVIKKKILKMTLMLKIYDGFDLGIHNLVDNYKWKILRPKRGDKTIHVLYHAL